MIKCPRNILPRTVLNEIRSSSLEVNITVTPCHFAWCLRLVKLKVNSFFSKLSFSDFVYGPVNMLTVVSYLPRSKCSVTNSPCSRWACRQSFFCLKLHADEANGQYNANWPTSIVYVSKPLTAEMKAIVEVKAVVDSQLHTLSTVSGLKNPVTRWNSRQQQLKTCSYSWGRSPTISLIFAKFDAGWKYWIYEKQFSANRIRPK